LIPRLQINHTNPVMFEKTILDFHGLEVKVTDHADEGILNILNHAVQGSEGGLRFSLQNISQRIDAYKEKIRFVSLYKKSKITGTVGACFRISGLGALRYPSTYIRYLAFQSTVDRIWDDAVQNLAQS